jgi:hypothetical protein
MTVGAVSLSRVAWLKVPESLECSVRDHLGSGLVWAAGLGRRGICAGQIKIKVRYPRRVSGRWFEEALARRESNSDTNQLIPDMFD